MKLIYILLQLVDRVLQLLVPVRRNRVCYISFPDYTDNAYYVYRHALEAREDIEHVWLLQDTRVAARIEQEFAVAIRKIRTSGHILHVVRKYSIKGYFLYLTSRCIFHTHGGYPFSTAALRRVNFCLWHGMPIKRVGRLNHVTPNLYPIFGKTHLATSHLFKYIVATAFGADPSAVKVCSLPRCDAFRRDSILSVQASEIRNTIGVADNQRLVLWMPTFRTESRTSPGNIRTFLDDLPDWVMTELDHACGKYHCKIIVKLHPSDFLNESNVPLLAEHIRLLKSADWIKSGIQLYELIAASDALISDVSSVLVDYLPSGRPIGVAGFDDATYSRGTTIPMWYLLTSQRFQYLVDRTEVESFFAKVASGDTQITPPNDVATMLHESFAEKGAEAVLREAGL